MIIGALISFIVDGWVWLMSFLSESQGLPPEISASFEYLIDSALSLNYYFPVDTLLKAFAIYIAISLALLVFEGVKFFISIIRGVRLN